MKVYQVIQLRLADLITGSGGLQSGWPFDFLWCSEQNELHFSYFSESMAQVFVLFFSKLSQIFPVFFNAIELSRLACLSLLRDAFAHS